ncbi:helix-turn-helix domain-containing protein [Janibacter sp. GS2]|uniref:helix-turn-helix domain-containing protein n=1 Tax=Janibacter sp. GS2 TaxID=3442646 RepID=UPI003EB9B05F
MTPVRTPELSAVRARLDVGTRVGLVVRRFRRRRLLSQRSMADELGWHHSTLSRAEKDISTLTVRKVETLLRHTGHRLAIVPDTVGVASALGEDPDEAWGAPDLLARDGQGRRLPPYGRVTWNSVIDRRLYARIVGHEAEWTWRRPRG